MFRNEPVGSAISNVELERAKQLAESNKFDLVERTETGGDRLTRIFLTYTSSIVFRTVQPILRHVMIYSNLHLKFQI